MNKINSLILALLIVSSSLKAQNVADFENLSLSPESYWDGSDLSGLSLASEYTSSFNVGDVTLNNTWNSKWSYWSDGWIYSNNTDSITSGSSNLSSSIAGHGVNNSSNYAIGMNNVYLHLDTSNTNDLISGIYVTNNTYAHNSMRDGDQFAKKFTNADQDYYKLTITSINNGIDVDSVEFFLADFTHIDSTQDYILNDWQYVDLTPLGFVDSIKFSLSSSDNGTFGMNTPAFFAIDDIVHGASIYDFENLTLSPDSFFDGSDLSGTPDNPDYFSEFSSGPITLNNIWNNSWSYWKSGWIYSNTTDSVTSGFANLSSSKAGSGYMGSDNYVVGKSKSYITYDSPQEFSAFISNNTYAANSMRDGDGFAKKFTNADQDYLKLHFYGYLNGILIDSSILYLADFTHTDSTLDYIVNVTPGFGWQYIEIPSNNVDSVVFQLESSDVGAFGMNTPDFFCMDNVGNYPLSISENNDIAIKAYPNPTKDYISFNNIADINEYKVSIIDFYGKEVISNLVNPKSVDVSILPSGQYIIKIVSGDKIKYDKVIKI
ncbi:MAG: hypothetical protein CL846_02775 [Crocinitomicaceae bacterium]|nr:hypothetical protein [Crocinitomicaceae bacterium]|tara:strand:- start:5186 stop:6820 length:1635 start_codon:yes stop_codon:yes gene_type:complete